ncbi:MAG: Bacterial Ig-like domain (group 2) [Deltaproteobacteria bacterium ADurb.BinA179]|nr:Ig-like domain-containing protein [Deltaproteobacteria bacterium]MDI9543472.1 Ig-like domain-containing protein [Pseudomonadota bacterium]OPZ26608.1 MAG: Bacterial Ig-like domain (group 2) [Deltaproteobacteria bacterium ADurb.BinA179]HOD70076.1 Ig-like domain-containing protein [Deltaproteobacteria bacterium]HOE71598.1 Ig-like domain-containing protein [Deltaproteobacteria bacterium]
MTYISRSRSIKTAVLFSLMALLSACSSDDSDNHNPQAQGASLSSLAITPQNPSIRVGQTRQFTAVGTYSDRSSTHLSLVVWTSSDENVATISDSGLATAHALGETTITATRGGVSASTILTVTESPTVPELPPLSSALVVDHTCTDLNAIPEDWINAARESLCIAYGHTSHGSQIISGMSALAEFKGSTYAFNASGAGGALELRDTPFAGAEDLGNPSRTAWANATRAYLDEHPEVNVVMWSWCGQVSDATQSDIDTYLGLMDALENEYPDVQFVYMTGHLDGTGLTGNLHLRNEQIRRYCIDGGKILYDFADIETYDPDGVYYGDRFPNDACDYDSDGDGVRDANWAREWQNSHMEGRDWYDCYSAHSEPLNANLKAYAAWWLWASIAGWDGR